MDKCVFILTKPNILFRTLVITYLSYQYNLITYPRIVRQKEEPRIEQQNEDLSLSYAGALRAKELQPLRWHAKSLNKP